MGRVVEPLAPDDINGLGEALVAAGVDVDLVRGNYAVVFVYPGMGVGMVYPELAGCTSEVCTFIEQAAAFLKHGIQVVGLSGEATDPPESCVAIPFPVGLLPQESFGAIAHVVRDGRRYAVRSTYVCHPDGSGVRITGIGDVVGHVGACFDLAQAHRLGRYRREAVDALASAPRPPRALSRAVGVLPNGSDSLAITRVDVTVPLVCKMASPELVKQEAGYIDRVNRLLEDSGRPPLFPRVVAVETSENPAWYLMEAADPTPLDAVLFADRPRTIIAEERQSLLDDALDALCGLYVLTFASRIAPVARYHYVDRFASVMGRDDTRKTYRDVVGPGRVEDLLSTPAVIDGVACRPYDEQVLLLDRRASRLLQPVSANLHGDAHLPNMLLLDGEVRFIDPRTVWDGNDVADAGVGDPIYDLATLFHSVHGMSAILRAVAHDETDTLLHLTIDDERLEARSRVLRIHNNPVVDWFYARMATSFPVQVLGEESVARLHVGAANALVGWLKSAHALPTRAAWLSVFTTALYHLEVANRLLEDDDN